MAQIVGPLYELPPHWPHSLWIPVAPTEVVDVVEVVRGIVVLVLFEVEDVVFTVEDVVLAVEDVVLTVEVELVVGIIEVDVELATVFVPFQSPRSDSFITEGSAYTYSLNANELYVSFSM